MIYLRVNFSLEFPFDNIKAEPFIYIFLEQKEVSKMVNCIKGWSALVSWCEANGRNSNDAWSTGDGYYMII